MYYEVHFNVCMCITFPNIFGITDLKYVVINQTIWETFT